jgi:hypothetical protein
MSAVVIHELLQSYIIDASYETSIFILASYSLLDNQIVTTQDKILDVHIV